MAFTLPIGTEAPNFNLKGVDGKTYSLEDFRNSKILIVVFSCNHCPHAIGVEDRLNKFYSDYKNEGMAMISINSNESQTRPADSFDAMQERASTKKFQYPYVRDEEQTTALKYGALRTPPFFVFDQNRLLQYTGRMDDNTLDPTKTTTNELQVAVTSIIENKKLETPLTNPIGCNIKWKGRDGHWVPPEACDLV